MKRIIIAAVLSLVIATSFANDNNKASITVVNNLKAEFPGASEVQWTLKSEFTKADFTYEGRKTQAFYTQSGERFAVGQVLSIKDIPSNATRKINKEYAGYTIGEVISFEQTEQPLKYYVSVENTEKKLILEVSSQGKVSLFKKSTK